MPETIFGGALAGLQQAQEMQYREAMRIAQQTMQQAELAQRDKEFSLRLQGMEDDRQARQDYQADLLAERARQFNEREDNRRREKAADRQLQREKFQSEVERFYAGLSHKDRLLKMKAYYDALEQYEAQAEPNAPARAFWHVIQADLGDLNAPLPQPGATPGAAPAPAGPITPVPLGAPPPMPGAMQFPGAKDVGPPGQALGPRPMPPEQQQGLTQRPRFGVLPGAAKNIQYKDAIIDIARAREKWLAASTALTNAKTLTEDEMRALRIAKEQAEIEYKKALTDRLEALLPYELKGKQAELMKTYEDIAASQQKRAGGAMTPDDVRQIQTSERGEDALIAGYRKIMQGIKNELPYIKVAIQKKQNEINTLNRAWRRDDAAIKLLEEQVKALTEDQLAKESLLDEFQKMINSSLQRKRGYQDMLAKGGVRVPATKYGTEARGSELPPAKVNTGGLPGFPDSQTPPPGQPFWPDGRPWRGIPYATTPVVPRGQSSGRSAPPPTRQAPKTQPPGRQEAKKSAPPAKKPATRAAAPGFDVLNPAAGYRAGDLLLPGRQEAKKSAPPAKKPGTKPTGKKKSVKDMTDDELFRQMMGR